MDGFVVIVNVNSKQKKNRALWNRALTLFFVLSRLGLLLDLIK